MTSRFGTQNALLTVLLALASSVVDVEAKQFRDDPQPQRAGAVTPEVLATRMLGGAELIHVFQPHAAGALLERAAEDLVATVRKRGHHGNDARQSWRRFDRAFRDLRSAVGDRGARAIFVFQHLAADLELMRVMIGATRQDQRDGHPEHSVTTGHHRFVTQDACVGTKRVVDRACPDRRTALRFRVPQQVRVIRRVSGEWRDFGAHARAQILLNGQHLWTTDVAKDWDRDDKKLSIEVPQGSILTLRSENGDLIHVRDLEIEFETRGRALSPWGEPLDSRTKR